MIYGAQSNPLMGLPSIDAVEPIRQIGIDTFAESTELHPQLIGNDGQR